MVLFLEIGPPFVTPCVCPSGQHLDSHQEGHRHCCRRPSHLAVHFPSRGRARWVGGRRWPLSRRRQTSNGVSFYFPCISFWGRKLYSCFQGRVSFFSVLLGMLVAKWEPTPCYRDACSVGIPNSALWEKGWQKHGKTMISPFLGRFFLVSKRTIFFFGGVLFWVLCIGRARHPGPGLRVFTPSQLSIEFANVGGWLTSGDLALDSCAQFLAAAEHRLIPSRARSICHQLRKAGFHEAVPIHGKDRQWFSVGPCHCVCRGLHFLRLCLTPGTDELSHLGLVRESEEALAQFLSCCSSCAKSVKRDWSVISLSLYCNGFKVSQCSRVLVI